MWKLLYQLEVRHPCFYAKCLGLVGTRHHTDIVVRQHHYRLVLQVGSKDTLAGDVAVIAINNAVHHILLQGFMLHIATPHTSKSSSAVTRMGKYFLLAGFSSM